FHHSSWVPIRYVGAEFLLEDSGDENAARPTQRPHYHAVRRRPARCACGRRANGRWQGRREERWHGRRRRHCRVARLERSRRYDQAGRRRGKLLLSALRGGGHSLRVERVGFRSLTTSTFLVRQGDTFNVPCT